MPMLCGKQCGDGDGVGVIYHTQAVTDMEGMGAYGRKDQTGASQVGQRESEAE